ncbi:uncharacterized protein LOC112188254 isoform X2 [Rosa chinensis]|nr:uncharacterized protein LOC112188254 isoform X2 [Rosa chinensis]
MDPLQSLCGRKKQEIIYQNPKYVLIISSSSSSIPSDSVEEEVEAVLYVTGVCEIQIGGEKRSLGYEKEEEILKILVEEFIDISVKKKEVQLLKSLLEVRLTLEELKHKTRDFGNLILKARLYAKKCVYYSSAAVPLYIVWKYLTVLLLFSDGTKNYDERSKKIVRTV